MRHARTVAAALAAAFISCGNAAPGSDSPNPLAAVDLNRTAIVADIVESFRSDVASENPAGAELALADLRTKLAALRADRLLAASLASSYPGLQSVLRESKTMRDAQLKRLQQKAFGDPGRDLDYNPLTPCRLLDTRGFGAPIQGGAFAPNTRRSYVPNGLCSIPTSGIASLLISFTTENLTPTSGGYISILAPALPVTATVDVFNLNSEWSASNTVVATGAAGEFDVFVANANAHVVIDVLGYFAPPPAGAVGTAQIADGAVTAAKLAASGCTTDQVLKFNGSSWVCASITPASLPCSAGDVLSCYTGPAGTLGVGACKAGSKICSAGVFGPCVGQVTPVAEIADGIDNDCNGVVDNGFPTATVVTPEGTRRAAAVITYTIADANSAAASILVEYSTNGGSTWSAATRFGTSGDPTTGLTTSPGGTIHHFFWASLGDSVALAGPTSNVRVRITPTTGATGAPVATDAFAVDNDSQKVIGTATGVFLRDGSAERVAEVAIGDLVADGLRAAAGTQLFIQNSGSIRAPLPSAFAPTNHALRRTTGGYAAGPPYDLVVGDVYNVYPFGNYIRTMTVTGAQLWAVLEHSVSVLPTANSLFLQVSGLSFVYSIGAAAGSRVQSVTLTANSNSPILNDNSATYTIGMSEFTAGGGDGYAMLSAIPTSTSFRIEADALLNYIQSQGTIAPTTSARITQVP